MYTQLQLLLYTHCTGPKPASISPQVLVRLYNSNGWGNYYQLKRSHSGETVELEGGEPVINTPLHLAWHFKRDLCE